MSENIVNIQNGLEPSVSTRGTNNACYEGAPKRKYQKMTLTIEKHVTELLVLHQKAVEKIHGPKEKEANTQKKNGTI